MLSRWIAESGVSRGQRTSFRSSFNATDAARWIRFCIAPEAIVPSVPIEHGQTTYASTFADPDAYGARQSAGSWTTTFSPVPSVSRASVSSRERRASPYSSVASTSIAALETETPTSQSEPASACSSRRAYGAPDAPRKLASFLRLSSPRPANDGIGVPGFTHAGHFRWFIWKVMPLFFAPSALRFGAPGKPPPVPL